MFSLHQAQQLSSRSSGLYGRPVQQPFVSSQRASSRRLEVSAGAIGPGKRWEHYETNKKTGKVVRPAMHIRKGDTVQIIAGKDKNKIGKISKVLTKTGQIVVDGINIKYKTRQPQTADEKGKIEQTESPIHHSNAMLYSEEKKVRSRVGHKLLDNGKKVRYLIKTGEVVDKQ